MKMDSRARKIFNKFPRDVKEYFHEVNEKCQKYGVTFKVSGGRSVNADCGRSGGYFNDSTKELAVAIGSNLESSMGVLIHEFFHMEKQWKNPKSIWKNRKIYNGYNRFFHYLNGGRIYKIDSAITSVVSLELECEKMAVREIKRRWTKYINVDKYCRQSFSYLASFFHMAKTKKWPKISPCHRKFLAHCPDKLPRSLKKVPENLQAAFDRFLR